MHERSTYSRLKPLLKTNRYLVATIVGTGLLGIVFESISIGLIVPFVYSLGSENFNIESDVWIVDVLNEWTQVIPENNRVLILLSVIFGLIILKSLVTFLHEYVSSKGYSELAYSLRKNVFGRLMTVEMNFVDHHQSGKLINTLNDQTWVTTDAIFSVANMLIHTFSIAILTILLFLVSWQLTLLVMVVGGLISVATRLVTKQIATLSAEGVKSEEGLTSQIIRSVLGLRTVRMFNQQENEERLFNYASKNIKDIHFKIDILTSLIQPISEILAMVFVAAAFIWLTQFPDQLPLVITLVIILYRLHPQIIMLDESRTDLLSSSAAVKAVIDLLGQDKSESSLFGDSNFSGLNKSIEFSDLSFAYGSADDLVLEKVSLQLKKNQTTAIVGPSGSGKSTLINLLLGFYQPTHGDLLVDGQPLVDLNLASWRQHIAIVSQDIQLFNLSVLENISYGNVGATYEQVVEAAKLADAHDFICEFENGYESVVGDRGAKLSGGQKQRIALARAILRDAEILVLDEATNALDSISEHEVFKTINQLTGSRTIILISHNLSTIANADQIFVLEAGRLIEAGSMKDLVAEGGLFAELYALQNEKIQLFTGNGAY